MEVTKLEEVIITIHALMVDKENNIYYVRERRAGRYTRWYHGYTSSRNESDQIKDNNLLKMLNATFDMLNMEEQS